MIITRIRPEQLYTSNAPANGNVLIYNSTTGKLTWTQITISGSYTTFLELLDTPSGYIPDKWLKVNATGDALILTDAPAMSGGSSSFITLTDTPASYTGQAGGFAVVNQAEDGLEFTTIVESEQTLRYAFFLGAG